MSCGLAKDRRMVAWSSPSMLMLKLDVDRAVGGKPGPTGTGEALCDEKGDILCMFFKSVGARDSNEA